MSSSGCGGGGVGWGWGFKPCWKKSLLNDLLPWDRGLPRESSCCNRVYGMWWGRKLASWCWHFLLSLNDTALISEGPGGGELCGSVHRRMLACTFVGPVAR